MCIKYLNHSSNVSFLIFPRYCKVYTGCLGLAGRLIDFCVNASLPLEGHFLPSSYPLYNLFKESAMFKWFSQQFATVASYLASMCQPRDARWAAAWLSIVVSETGYRWPYCFIVLSFFFSSSVAKWGARSFLVNDNHSLPSEALGGAVFPHPLSNHTCRS